MRHGAVTEQQGGQVDACRSNETSKHLGHVERDLPRCPPLNTAVPGAGCRAGMQMHAPRPPSFPWLLLCCGSLHSSERLKKSVAVLRGISLSLMIPSPYDQLQQTLLTHEAVLHAGHVSPLCKSAHCAEDTAASSCRSVLPAAILGWTWRACSWAPAAPRAGHREKRKRSDSYHSPQEAVTQTEACT